VGSAAGVGDEGERRPAGVLVGRSRGGYQRILADELAGRRIVVPVLQVLESALGVGVLAIVCSAAVAVPVWLRVLP